MATMRTFNPMLSVLAVGELLLTPRGLFALGRRSFRTVRQQVKILEDVGEELVHGGREVLGRRRQEDKPQEIRNLAGSSDGIATGPSRAGTPVELAGEDPRATSE
jgi:hypothetical protein